MSPIALNARRLQLGPDSSGALLTPEEFDSADYVTPLLPGFELALDRLLARADMWD